MKKKFNLKSLFIGFALTVMFLGILSPRTVYAKETEITEEIQAEISKRLERAFKAGKADADLSDLNIIVNMYSDRIGEQYQKILDVGYAFAKEHGYFVLGSHKEPYISPCPTTVETKDCDKYGVGPNRVTAFELCNDAFYRRPDGSADLKLIAATQKKVTQEYEYAMSVVSDKMSDVEKALVLYDYIIAMSNYPGAESIDENGIETYDSESYSALSVFRDNISVCVANATAYCYLLSDCGIPCIRVDSSDMEHSWAMVKVNGAWYHTDPTWDNSRYMDGLTSLGDFNHDIWDLGAVGHTYFLKSDKEMKNKLQHFGWTLAADYTKDGSQSKTPKSGSSGSFDDTFFSSDGYWMNDVHYNYVNGDWYFLNRVTNQIVKTDLGRDPKKAEIIDAPTDNMMKFVYGSGEFLFICEEDGIWRYNTRSGEMGRLPLSENHTKKGQPVFNEMNIASGRLNGVVVYSDSKAGSISVEFSYPVEKVLNMKVDRAGSILTDRKTGAKYKITKAGSAATFCGTDSVSASVTIPGSVTLYGVKYNVTSIAANAFKKNRNITTVMIGKNVKTIGKNAFNSCTKLKTVKGCRGVTSIAASAFQGCSKLTSMAMGAELTTIGDKAFFKCAALVKITIPAKVTRIGNSSFQDCNKLKTITIKSTKLTTEKVGAKAFTGTAVNATVKVPEKLLKAYQKWLVKKGVNKKAKIKS